MSANSALRKTSRPRLLDWIENFLEVIGRAPTAGSTSWQVQLRACRHEGLRRVLTSVERTADAMLLARLRELGPDGAAIRDDDAGRAVRASGLAELWPTMQTHGLEREIAGLLADLPAAARSARLSSSLALNLVVPAMSAVADDSDCAEGDLAAREDAMLGHSDRVTLQATATSFLVAIERSKLEAPTEDPRAWIYLCTQCIAAVFDLSDGQWVLRRIKAPQDPTTTITNSVTLEDVRRAFAAEIQPLKRQIEKTRISAETNSHEAPIPLDVRDAIPTSEIEPQSTVTNRIPDDGLQLEERAIGLLVKHSDWSVATIAAQLGCARNSPYRWKKFMEALRTLKNAQMSKIPRGTKDRETGTIEAVDEDTGTPTP